MPVALAAANWVMFSGSKNSVRRMMPGWRRKAVGFMVVGLMIVNNLDLLGVGSGPAEADAPLVVDPDGMLSATIPFERLQMVAWRQIEECQFDGSIEQLQFDECALPEAARQVSGAPGDPQLLGVPVGETLDHDSGSAVPHYSSSEYYPPNG